MTSASYRQQLFALLPRGAAWAVNFVGGVFYRLLDGLALELARVDARAWNLLNEMDPRTTVEMLPDWERITGLPDPCLGGAFQTMQQRRNALVSKLTAVGGQSIAAIIAQALAMGFVITITEFHEFRAGISHAGDALTNGVWVFAWQVNAPLNSITYFTAGQSACGDPLAAWGNTPLQCRLSGQAHAHTFPIFSYS